MLLPTRLQPLVHNPRHHLLKHSTSTPLSTLEVRRHALLHVLSSHIHLHVHIIALLLPPHHNLLLCIRDHHDLKPSLIIIHSCDSQARTIKRDVALLHDVPQHIFIPRLHAEANRIAVLPRLRNHSNGVHVSLDTMSTHSCIWPQSALEIDTAAFFQTAQVRPSKRLRRNADFELIFAELGHGQAGAVDAYTVTQMAVGEDLGAVGEGQRGAAAAGGGFIVLDEARDGWLGRQLSYA